MSSGWSTFITVVTLLSMAAMVWLLVTNRDKNTTGEELDHEFDGIRELDNPLPAWWVTLFMATVVFAVGYVFYYPALGNMEGAGKWSSQKAWLHDSDKHNDRFAELYKGYAAQQPIELVNNPQAMQTGRRLFLNYCSTCHGVAAKGGNSFPNLTDDEWMWGADFDAIKQTITNGRLGAMPPWGQVLNAEDLAAVSNYVESLSMSQSAKANNEKGMAVYALYCTACHGADAKGNAALGGPDLSNDIWLYGGSSEDITHSIASGRAGMMPSHGEILGADKIHLLAAYVLSLAQKESSSTVSVSD